MEKSPIPVTYPVPCDDYEDYCVFSYPEYNYKQQQVEPKIIDPSHCLTNLHLHATTKGFFDCKPEAFKAVCVSNNAILNIALVQQPILDKQNVPFAQKVFSKAVEDELEKLNYVNEALLVCTVRYWYNACNECGLSVNRTNQIST